MRISDWSSDVCSSDLFIDVSAVESMTSMIGDAVMRHELDGSVPACDGNRHADMAPHNAYPCRDGEWLSIAVSSDAAWQQLANAMGQPRLAMRFASRSEEHTSELQSLMRTSSAVFCLK